MASATRCSRSLGTCQLAVFIALAVLASPRRIGASATAESDGGPKWHVVSLSSLLPSAVCTAATKAASNSSTVRVVHRHGPCSPLPSSRGDPPSPAEILEREQERVDSIRQKIGGASAVRTSRTTKGGVSLPARQGTSLGSSNYIISVGLGTPTRNLTVEVDTGSDLSWVQCKPCRDCYHQQDPLFDPTRSSTYSSVPCSAHECQELTSSQRCSSGNKCRYEYGYADNSHTNGNLVRDTLTLSPSDKIPGFVFGCGDDDNGTFGEVDGLFGLGREKVSFSSQAAARYGAVGFSYCLPSSSSATGYLSLGVSAAPANAQFTAMVTRNDTPSFYYLDLIGIKVAGRALKIPSAVFKTTGTIIDSGTVVSHLPPRAYAALRSAFTRSMGQRYKRAPALQFLDTCYDFTGHASVRIPSVAMVFAGGTTLSLGARGVLYVSTVAQTCLAFAPIEDDIVGILGNTQQKTFTVVYDVANKKIGFGANGCG